MALYRITCSGSTITRDTLWHPGLIYEFTPALNDVARRWPDVNFASRIAGVIFGVSGVGKPYYVQVCNTQLIHQMYHPVAL